MKIKSVRLLLNKLMEIVFSALLIYIGIRCAPILFDKIIIEFVDMVINTPAYRLQPIGVLSGLISIPFYTLLDIGCIIVGLCWLKHSSMSIIKGINKI